MDVLSKLLFAFVTLIVGVVLLGTISTSVMGVNGLTTVSRETQDVTAAISGGITNTSYRFTVANAPTGWQAQDCPLTGVSVINATNATVPTTFYTSNGTWYLSGASTNTSKFWENNNSYVTYSYCGDDYLNISWGRSVLSVGVGMFALALLAVSVGLFYSIGRDYGIV